MENYKKIVEVLNEKISEFNELLNIDIKGLDLDKLNDDTVFTGLRNKTWKELAFPNPNTKGVYFIFGKNPNNNEFGVYIGKASFSSEIGYRLSAHLSKGKKDNNYTMLDSNGNVFELEYIYSLGLEPGLDILSCALEEYLITHCKDDIHLLNGVGNH